MVDEPILTSNPKYLQTFLGIAVLIFPVVLLYKSYHRIHEPFFPQIGDIVGVIMLFVCLIISRVLFLQTKKIIIYDDYIELKLFGFAIKKISRYDILSWMHVLSDGKNKYYTLTLFTTQGKLKIIEYNYKNYEDLYNVLTDGIEENEMETQKHEKKSTRNSGILFLCLSLLACWLIYISYQQFETKIFATDIVNISGTLTETPKVNKGSKGRRWISLNLKEYPNFHFHISGRTYRNLDDSFFISQKPKGDTITLGIMKKDYDMKITNTLKPDFWTKINAFARINVYTIEDNNYFYVTLQEVNTNKKDNLLAYVFFGIVAVGFLAVGLFLLYKSSKMTIAE